METTVTTFDSGEFEIAIVTYNRCDFVVEWLEHCYEQTKQRNIKLSIYDSSTNNDTEKYVNDFMIRMNDADMEYYRVNSDVNIGYKPMLPILNSKSKYVWVSGDSRYHDFMDLDRKVFPNLKKDVDYVVFHISNNEENDGKVYTNREELLRDCFLSMTCIGLSIYKTSLFEPLKCNEKLIAECTLKYKKNYGFAWIGYFLEMFSIKEYKALFSIVPIMEIKADKKIQSWFQRCYGCWIEDLCNLMDALSEKYKCTEMVIRDTWKYLAFDSLGFCDYARRKGDLNRDTYKKYKDSGMLERVTKRGRRLEKFANAADMELDECFRQEIEVEKKEFEELCRQNIERIEKCSRGRELWIYGAGKGGKVLLDCLRKFRIPVRGFLDKGAEKIKIYEGVTVKNICDIEPEKCFVIISLFHWTPFIIKSLLECGIKRYDILYLSVDG